jgi:hypothetical protein
MEVNGCGAGQPMFADSPRLGPQRTLIYRKVNEGRGLLDPRLAPPFT